MPQSQLILYQEKNGDVPLMQWLDEESTRVQIKAVAVLTKLAEFGHELRRPHADYLRDDIYELRFKDGRRNLRILYFFAGRNIVVASPGLAKEAMVPPRENDLAISRRERFLHNPRTHTYSIRYQNLMTQSSPIDKEENVDEKES